MQKLFILPWLFLFTYVGCFAQEKGKRTTSDLLKAPESWGKESFELPLSFMTDFGFFGIEEVRFAPGWDDSSSSQFWTYTFALFSFSPKEFDDDEWKVFDDVQSPEDCQTLRQATRTPFTTSETDQYELLLPKKKQTGVLLLFPGFPENPDVVKREFDVVAPAMEAGIALAVMKLNQKLWLEETEKAKLSTVINRMFEENNLDQENVYIGGFSSGGTISFLISDYLVQSESDVQPKGVFMIDSPVDLLGLYKNSQKNVKRNYSPVSVQESKMIISLLESNFGKPEDGIELYEEHAVYTGETHNTDNLSHLRDIELRFYTEPDTTWWKQNRQYEYEEMNAYFIKNLTDDLTEEFGDDVTYIPTKNRGYRSNGDRHPHAWSIVDIDDLIRWITDEQN